MAKSRSVRRNHKKTRKIHKRKSCGCKKAFKLFQLGGSQHFGPTPLQGATNSIGGQFIDIKGGQYFKNPVGGIAGGGKRRKTLKKRH